MCPSLLILYALGQLLAKNNSLIAYGIIREKLTYLIKEFGPIRKSNHLETLIIQKNYLFAKEGW